MGVPFLIPLLSVAASGIGGSLANRRQIQTIFPTLSPEDETFSNILRSRLQTRLATPFDFSGFEAGGITNINRTFDPIRASLEARLTSRGLGDSPVAAAGETLLEQARGSEIANFLNQIPLLRRDFETSDLQLAENFLAGRRGQTSILPGNRAGGFFTSAGSVLAFLAGMGAFNRSPKKSGNEIHV